MQDRRHNNRYQLEQVEIPQFIHIKRIDETFSGNTVADDRNDLLKPVKFAQHKDNKCQHRREENDSLDRIGDNDRQRTADVNKRDRQKQRQCHNKQKGRTLPAEKIEGLRQAQIGDKKACRNRRHDDIRHDFRH